MIAFGILRRFVLILAIVSSFCFYLAFASEEEIDFQVGDSVTLACPNKKTSGDADSYMSWSYGRATIFENEDINPGNWNRFK